jgi:hypothetical protein
MPSPFPGMDPYLETPDLWPDVHHELISQIRSALNPALRPHYVARVELRVYVSDDDDPGREVLVPDLRVEETKSKPRGKARTAPSVATSEPEIIPMLIDDEIEEARLEIRHRETGALVTIIEVLSPANKIRGTSDGKVSRDFSVGRALGRDRSASRRQPVDQPAASARVRLSHPHLSRR